MHYEDEDFVAFNDYRPAAEFHILVVPKGHFPSVHKLNRSHIEMISRMEAIGKELLSTKTDIQLADASFGFHWPITTISHLHLHVIAPKQNMPCLKRLEFHPWTYGTVDMALKMLECKNDPSQSEQNENK